MYKKTDEIAESKMGFLANEKFLFIPKKGKGFLTFDLINKFKENHSTDYEVYKIIPLLDNKLIVIDNYAHLGFLYVKNEVIKLEKEFQFVVNNRYTSFLSIEFIKKDTKDELSWLPALYDWQKDRVLWQKNYEINFVSDYIIARTSELNYSRLSIETGGIIWSFSFSDFGKTKDMLGNEEDVSIHSHPSSWIGVLDGELWLTLNNYQLLILNIETGKKIDLLGDAVERGNTTKKYVIGGLMDIKNKKIINVGNFEYREIDMKTRKVSYTDLTEEFNKYGVSSCECSFDDSYIYFYDKIFFGNQSRNKVAVLDRKTLKVVWVHDFAQYGTFPMQMEKTENHLFVLDSEGTLHIFEREE